MNKWSLNNTQTKRTTGVQQSICNFSQCIFRECKPSSVLWSSWAVSMLAAHLITLYIGLLLQLSLKNQHWILWLQLVGGQKKIVEECTMWEMLVQSRLWFLLLLHDVMNCWYQRMASFLWSVWMSLNGKVEVWGRFISVDEWSSRS